MDSKDITNSQMKLSIFHVMNFGSKLTRGSISDVLVQLGLGIGLSVATISIFSILRRNNEIIYMPRRSRKLGVGFISWLWPLLRTSENELLENIGLDAVIFLRLLKMCRWMCGSLALLACVFLIPCDLISVIRRLRSPCPVPQSNEDTRYRQGDCADKSVDLPPMANITNKLMWINAVSVEGSWLYPHIIYGYIGTLIVLSLIYFNYKSIIFLKWKWFRTPEYQSSILSRSIMLTHLDSKYISDTGLQEFFAKSHIRLPHAPTAVYFGRRVGILSFLIQCHNRNVRHLEIALINYLKDGSVSRKRPMIRAHQGIACMWGERVDAINFYTRKIKEYKHAIQKERHDISSYEPESYAFASFATVAHAHIVAKELNARRINGVSISLAPPPQDIIWDNLTKPRWIIWCQRALARILIIIFGIIYTFPLAIILFMAQVIFDPELLKILAKSNSNFSWVLIFSLGPPLLSLLIQLAPLAVLRALGKFKRTTTHQECDRGVLSGYYCFLAAFQFLFFSGLGYVVVRTLDSESVGLRGQLGLLVEIYLVESNFWLTWFPLKIFTASIKLVQVFSFLSSIRFKLLKTNRTPREIREWTKPSDFDYAVHVANILFMLLVALIYAPLALLVTILATAVFYASSWIYKYQLMYISVTKCESGGRIWQMFIDRILFSLIVMQGFLFVKIAAHLGVPQSLAVLPLCAIVIAFKLFLKLNFDLKFGWYIPTRGELSKLQHHYDDAQQNRLVKQFGHPLLHEELLAPMIHKDHQKFLERIYNEQQADSDTTADEENPLNCTSETEMNYLDGPDSRIDFQPQPTREPQVQVGGLRFSVISKDNPMYSHREFIREKRGANIYPTFPLNADESMRQTNQNSITTIQSGFNLYSPSNNDIHNGYQHHPGNDLPKTPSTMHEYPPEFIGRGSSPSEPPNNMHSDIRGSSSQELLR